MHGSISGCVFTRESKTSASRLALCACARDICDCIFVRLWHSVVEFKTNISVPKPATQCENQQKKKEEGTHIHLLCL